MINHTRFEIENNNDKVIMIYNADNGDVRIYDKDDDYVSIPANLIEEFSYALQYVREIIKAKECPY